jgi:hypothetical protein
VLGAENQKNLLCAVAISARWKRIRSACQPVDWENAFSQFSLFFAVGTFEAGRVAFYTSFGVGVLSILRPSVKLALRG